MATPLCFEDNGRNPSQLFALAPELGDGRGQRLGIAELEVYAGEHSQPLRGGHGRPPTRGPAKGDELLAQREPLGGFCRGFQGDRAGKERRGQCRRIRGAARQLNRSICERSAVPALELVGGRLERLDGHEPRSNRRMIVTELLLRLVEQRADLIRVQQDRGIRLGEHGDGSSELFR